MCWWALLGLGENEQLGMAGGSEIGIDPNRMMIELSVHRISPDER